MHSLTEVLFTSKWKSFKIFKSSGAVVLNTYSRFTEFDFASNRMLTITSYNGGAIEQLVQTDQWTITLQNKRHYLTITAPKLIYEVITINHTLMVLADPVRGEKTFFVKDQYWPEHLQSARSIIL